jgi:hypothetical protein
MIRALILAAGLSLAASAAHAQACLALNDGFGTTTVTCPDGRQGVLHTDPGGGVAGMIGTQPFSGTTAGVDPGAPPSGVPSSGFFSAPAPPAIEAPTTAPAAPPLATPPIDPQATEGGLTALQRDYLAEQREQRLRNAVAERRRIEASGRPQAFKP